MKKYLVEFIGTFFLVFVIGMTVIDPGVGSFAPIAIGATLMVMIFAGGHISGGHFNPAVTLAVWLRGRCAAGDVPFYLAAQILGAWVAAAGVLCLKGHPVITPKEIQIVPSLVAELIGTFALCYVVLNVATAKGTANNSFYGLAIGSTVMAMVFALGGVSGGVLNPAVAVGITKMHLVDSMHLWLYFTANLGAGALAALVFKFINAEDK